MARRRPSRSTASDPRTTASPAGRAWDAACRYLARAPRTAFEIEHRLVERGFAPDVVGGALQALADLRYIDDAMLARRRAEELLLRRGWGRLRVAAELTRRGVVDSVAETAIAAALEGHGEAELARRALQRRFAERASRVQAFRFLVRRGYPIEIVSDLLGSED